MAEQVNVRGIGFGSILFIVFLVLKLCSVIDWSWWWVTAPLWIPVALFLGFFALVAVIGFIVIFVGAIFGK